MVNKGQKGNGSVQLYTEALQASEAQPCSLEMALG